MKIALCLEYPIGLQGGVSVLVEALARGLRERYELVLVSPDSPESLAAIQADQLFVQHIRWEPGRVGPVASRILAEQLVQSGVKLAHFHSGIFGWGNRFAGSCPILHARRRGIRVCTTVHLAGDWLDGFCGPAKPLWFKLLLFPIATLGKLRTLSCEEREICVSQHACRMLARRYWPYHNRFVQIYHSRVRAGSLSPQERPRRKVVLCVGHIARRKGQHVLIEAFGRVAADYPDWELWLAGPVVEKRDGEEIERLANAAPSATRVRFLGERPDAMALMRQAAIYVQPSFLEGLPLALQEAMFYGCACIGSRIAAHEELIRENETGLLFNPGDVAQLARALEQLMDDGARRDHFGRAASRSMIDRGMTWENMIQEHLKIYETMLRRK